MIAMQRQFAMIAALLVSAPAAAQEWEAPVAIPDAQAVMIGLDGSDMDACGGLGRTMAEDFIGDSTLAVRSAPDENGEEVGSLPERSLVWLCEGAGPWQGIVYSDGEFQELGDCRVSAPVAEPQAYDGPCVSGWVPATSILLTAG